MPPKLTVGEHVRKLLMHGKHSVSALHNARVRAVGVHDEIGGERELAREQVLEATNGPRWFTVDSLWKASCWSNGTYKALVNAFQLYWSLRICSQIGHSLATTR